LLSKFRFQYVHPILFSLFFPLSMLQANYGVTPVSEVIRPMVFTAIVSIIVYSLVFLVLRNWEKTSAISFILLFIFFTFGHLYDLLKPVKIFSFSIGRIRFILPVLILLAAFLIFIMIRSKTKLRNVNWLLFFVSVFLLVSVIGQLVFAGISFAKTNTDLSKNDLSLAVDDSIVKRDVYYIILDKYTRDDYLSTDYGLDTSEFINQLEDMGFYVASCSQPNYTGTALSLASSLNYEYLDTLAPDLINQNRSWSNFAAYIKDSKARQFFTDLGYKFVTAETAHFWVNISDSDVYLKRNVTAGQIELTSFETMFLQSTLIRAVYGLTPLGQIKTVVPYERSHYERILFTLDQMKKVPEITSPTFSYIHLVVPHHPYVFTPEGEYLVTEDEKTGYLDNIRFINKQIIPVLEEIISKSEVPPIIVLQADHGNDGDDVYAIFNAYYLPGIDPDVLYPGITPVNTFRVILDNYFNTNLGLLEDVTYTWEWEGVYDFGVFPNTCSR